MVCGDIKGLHAPCELSTATASSDPNFDRVTQLASTIFGLPFCALIVVGPGGPELKSTHGLTERSAGPTTALSELLRVGDAVCVVPDVRTDPLLAGVIPAIGDQEVRFFASAPLVGTSGLLLGSLSVLGCEPRHNFGQTEIRILQGLADMAVELVELRRDQLVLLEQSREVTRLAHQDPLTELGNRRHLDRSLGQALRSLRPQGQIVLYCVDLDGFKRVNDTLGHGAGDLLLRHVTARLRGEISAGDTIARIGGDEFAILQSGDRAVAESARFANDVIAAVSRPYGLNGRQVRIGTSIGAAVGRYPAPPPEQLLREADRALYRAKAAGRGRFAMSDSGRTEPNAPRFILTGLRFDPSPKKPRSMRVTP